MRVPSRQGWSWVTSIAVAVGLVSGCDFTEKIPLEKERPVIIISPPGSQAASKARISDDAQIGGSATSTSDPNVTP